MNSPDKTPIPQACPSTAWGLCDWVDTSTCREGQTEHAEHWINASPSTSILFGRNEEKVPTPGGTLLATPCPPQVSILPVGLGSPQGSLLLSLRTTYLKAQLIFREPGKKAGCVTGHSLPWEEMLVTREAGWRVGRPPLPLLALWPSGEWQAGHLGLGRMFADWGPAPQRAPPSYPIHSCVSLLDKRE